MNDKALEAGAKIIYDFDLSLGDGFFVREEASHEIAEACIQAYLAALPPAPVDEVQNLAIALHATEVENTWAEVPFSELVNWSQDSYRVRAKKIITRLRAITKEKT